MNPKLIWLLIGLDSVLGFSLMLLNLETNKVSFYNFIMFIVIVYLYTRNYEKKFVPFFILEFFVFGLVLLNRLFPAFLSNKNSIVNYGMIGLGIAGVAFMLLKSYQLARKYK